jgi:hypothetical protein
MLINQINSILINSVCIGVKKTFGDTEGTRQHNDQSKMKKNDLKILHRKLKIEQQQSH